MTPIITVEVDKNGEVTIEVSGVQGNGCHALTAGVERALGKVVDTHDKPEAVQLGAQQSAEMEIGNGSL